MTYEQRDLTGSLFKNARKETETHPDYTGRALISGTEYFLDAWINTDRNGGKYMSLKLKPKEARGNPGSNATYGSGNRPPEPADLEDDAPFF